MADADKKETAETKDFQVNVPMETPGFFLRGSAHLQLLRGRRRPEVPEG